MRRDSFQGEDQILVCRVVSLLCTLFVTARQHASLALVLGEGKMRRTRAQAKTKMQAKVELAHH